MAKTSQLSKEMITLSQDLIQACQKDDMDNVLSLIDKGAGLNYRNKLGFSAFDYAVQAGQWGYCEALLAAGYKVIKKNSQLLVDNCSIVVAAHKRYIHLAQALIRYGANINQQLKTGRTALHHSIINDDVSMFKLLVKGNADCHLVSYNGATILHVAAAQSNLYYLQKILGVIDKDVLDHQGLTAFDYALQRQNWAACDYLLKHGFRNVKLLKLTLIESVKLNLLHLTDNLLESQAVDDSDELGNTALHYAVQNSNTEMIELLLKHHANIYAQNHQKQTPMSMAVESNHAEAIELLTAFRNKVLNEVNQKFFKVERCRNLEALEIGKQLSEVMRGERQTQVEMNVCARSANFAKSYLYSQSLMKINDNIAYFQPYKNSYTQMAEKFDWSNFGNKNTSNFQATKSWPRFEVSSFGVNISFQPQPSPSQIANLKIYGVGAYGAAKDKDILAIVNQFTGSTKKKPSVEKEKKLGKIMLDAMKTGQGITQEKLEQQQIIAPLVQVTEETVSQRRELIESLNRIIYLVGVEETHRRLYPFIDAKDREVYQALPMGIAVAIALSLVAQGHLTFHDILSVSKPNFGPYTGLSINSKDGIDEFYEKLDRLLQKYYAENPKSSFSYEGLHRLLLDTFGGEYDSDGDEYLADEQTQTSEHEQTSLHLAVKNKNILQVKSLIRQGSNLNTQDEHGCTALYYAVQHNLADMVNLLLANGANPAIHEKLGKYPLYQALKNGNQLIEARLKQYGASTVFVAKEPLLSNIKELSLHTAIITADTLLFEMCLQLTKNLDIQDLNGRTPLILAVIKKRIDFIKKLLEKNASCDVKDHHHKTALDYAVDMDHPYVIRTLLARTNPLSIRSQDENNQTKLHQAIIHGNSSLFFNLVKEKKLLNKVDSQGCSALILAAKYKQISFIKALLENGAIKSIKDHDDKKALNYAKENNMRQFYNKL